MNAVRSGGALTLALAIVVILSPSPAGAATQLGETFAPATTCNSATFIQTGSPGPSYAAPSAGVITRWSVEGGSPPPQLKLKVARPTGGDNFTIVGDSALVIPGPNMLSTFITRIPAQAGDVIGFHIATQGRCARTAASTFTFRAFSGDPAPGSTVSSAAEVGVQLDVAATLEPDADSDGYGDETQDLCPSDATTQKTCNDGFANAQAINGFSASVAGTTLNATRQVVEGEPDHCLSASDADDECQFWVGDHTVWYRWTAPASGSVTIDTCSAAIDSILAVYTGSVLDSLTRVVDDNNNCQPASFGSRVTFDAVAATTYNIVVGDAGGAQQDSFTLNLALPEPLPPPDPGGGGGAGDTSAPNTQITQGPKNKTKKRTASFAFSSSESGSTFECRLDNRPFEPCTSPKSYKVSKGKHSFAVRARDAAGNVDATPATDAWEVKKKK